MIARRHNALGTHRNAALPFEWEELPSLSHVLLRRHGPRDSYALDPLQPSAPLHDTAVAGLAAREIVEPEVFKHFFGPAAQRWSCRYTQARCGVRFRRRCWPPAARCSR